MTDTRETVIVGLVLLLAAVSTAVGVSLSEQSLAFALSPMAVLVVAAAVLFAFAVISGRKWPVALVFIIAILVFNTAFRTEGLEGRKAGFDAVSFMRFGVFLSAFAVGVVAIAKTYTLLLRPPGIYVFLYWCVAFLSFVYSRDSIYTLAAAFGLLAWISLATTMAQRFTLRELLISILGACTVFICLSWVFYLFVPELGRFATGGEGDIIRFIGIAGQPNAAGQIMAIYIVSLVCLYVGDPRGFRQLSPLFKASLLFVGVLALGGLALSQSRGSTLGLMGALLLIFFYKTHGMRFALLGVFVTIPLIVIVFVSTFDPVRQLSDILVGVSRGGNLDEIMTLTGRTPIWAFTWEQIMNRPMFGHGYGAGQGVIIAGYIDRWGTTTGSAHNALLQTLLDLGFLGGALLIAIFAHSIYRMIVRPHPFRDAVFILVFVFCILESGISKAANVLSLIWIVSLFVDEMPISAEAPSQTEPGDRIAASAHMPAE